MLGVFRKKYFRFTGVAIHTSRNYVADKSHKNTAAQILDCAATAIATTTETTCACAEHLVPRIVA